MKQGTANLAEDYCFIHKALRPVGTARRQIATVPPSNLRPVATKQGQWVRALACTGDRTVLAGFESHCGKLRFGTLAIPFTPLCQCLSEETLKSRRPLLSGVYARGSKRSHQSALECVTVVDSTTLREGQL